MDFATVPAAPPAWKKCRATSWPAPISANVPYFAWSRLIVRALRLVVRSSDDSMAGFQYSNLRKSLRTRRVSGDPVVHRLLNPLGFVVFKMGRLRGGRKEHIWIDT